MTHKAETTAFEFCKVRKTTFQDAKRLKMLARTLPKRKGVEARL